MGYKIRTARQKAHMTQAELSAKSGVSRATISGLESGRVKVTTTETLLKIAAALGEDVEHIFLSN